MTRPWAVVIRPDGTHNVRALGPISTEEEAERVVDRIQGFENKRDERAAAEDATYLTLLPQAVQLESVAAFMIELKEEWQ